MINRLCLSFLVAVSMVVPVGAQTVVRFETTMGDFDMVLNPTNNSVLQNHVDNMLEYVDRGTYNGSWINRAPSGFVLQMGGFYSQTRLPQFSLEQVRNIRGMVPITGHPAGSNPPLSNTVGTVALALSGNPANPDSGSSSFFINLASNKFLDPQFTVFAAIPDMTVINNIMSLQTIDLTTDPNFPNQTGNLGLQDVPVQADGSLVQIKRTFVLTDNLESARALAGVQSVMSQSAQSFANTAGGASSSLGLSQNAVPEPASIVTMLIGLMGLMARRQKR